MENIYEKTFEGENFIGKPLGKGEYECCVFKNCDFLAGDLSDQRFMEVEFIDCNLSNAKLFRTSFQDTKFMNCKLLGLPFNTCNDFNLSIDFDHCQLNHSVFYQMKLNRSRFSGCQLHEVDFTEAEMDSTVLVKCDLLGAVFERTRLVKTDLRDSINYTIDPELNNIKGAKFSLPEVIRLLDKYGIEVEGR